MRPPSLHSFLTPRCLRFRLPSLPPQSTFACVPCWLSPSFTQRTSCSDCVASASTEEQAAVCHMCNSKAIVANEKTCYKCISGAPTWQAKGLCGVTPAPRQNPAVARALIDDYVTCVAAGGAMGETPTRLCTTCIAVNDVSRGRKCFKCLADLFAQDMTLSDLVLRAGLCPLP
jgi:hypothetical protein